MITKKQRNMKTNLLIMVQSIKINIIFVSAILSFIYFLIPLLNHIFRSNKYFNWVIDFYYYFLIPIFIMSSTIIFGNHPLLYLVYFLFFLFTWFLTYKLLKIIAKIINNKQSQP